MATFGAIILDQIGPNYKIRILLNKVSFTQYSDGYKRTVFMTRKSIVGQSAAIIGERVPIRDYRLDQMLVRELVYESP